LGPKRCSGGTGTSHKDFFPQKVRTGEEPASFRCCLRGKRMFLERAKRDGCRSGKERKGDGTGEFAGTSIQPAVFSKKNTPPAGRHFLRASLPPFKLLRFAEPQRGNRPKKFRLLLGKNEKIFTCGDGADPHRRGKKKPTGHRGGGESGQAGKIVGPFFFH